MTSATEAVQPLLASLILGLHLNPCECSVGEIGRKTHSRVCAFHHLSSRSCLFAGSLLLSGSELKIDLPKKAPFRWSYQGNLHYQLLASRLIWNTPAFDVLLFFFFFQGWLLFHNRLQGSARHRDLKS